MIWLSRLMALFLFFLAKSALAYLPAAHFVALRPLFLLACPVCYSFSTEACSILQALRWSQQHQQICHFFSLFLLSDCRFFLITLSFVFPFTSNSLEDLAGTVFSLSFFTIRLQWVLNTHFSWGMTQLMSWPDREHCS